MMDVENDLEQLDDQLDGLEGSINAANIATSAFQRELAGMQYATAAASAEARTLSRSISSSLKSAFSDLVIDGANLTDVLNNLARSMANAAFNQAIAPVTDAIGGAVGGLIAGILPFENGAAFSGGRVAAFAQGGIVDSPTSFAMRGGTGLMGEAGPEAIMPLARGADGKLGVRGGGGNVVNVTMNISTPDVAGFNHSRSQIAASLSRAIGHGQRNM